MAENRCSIQIWIYCPALTCSVCRSHSFQWPWKCEYDKPIPVLFVPSPTENIYGQPTFEIAGAATESELRPLARKSGWIVSEEGEQEIICPACQQLMRRYVKHVEQPHA